MNTAVIKLNALSDPVGTAAENDDFLPVRYVGFALVFVGRVEVGRRSGEFRGAGVDPFVDTVDAFAPQTLLDRRRRRPRSRCRSRRPARA